MSAGMSNASCSTSRYVSTRIGNDGNSRTVCSRSCALSRWSQSGMRRRGLPRGSSSARAAFMRKRAPNSDDSPISSSTASLRLVRREAPQGVERHRPVEIRETQHDAVVRGLHLHVRTGVRVASVAAAKRTRARDARAPFPTARSRVRQTARESRCARHSSRRESVRRRERLSSGTTPVACALLMNVLDERLCRGVIALVLGGDRVRSRLPFARRSSSPPQRADARREVRRARRVLAVPEGHSRRRARRRSHDHAIVLDRIDAPRRRAELKDVADARLVHELLVELTEARAVGQVDGVEAAIGNRSTINHRDESCAAERR